MSALFANPFLVLAGVPLALLGALFPLLRPDLLPPLLLVVASMVAVGIRIGGVAIYPSNVLVLAMAGSGILHGLRTGNVRFLPLHRVSLLSAAWILYLNLAVPGAGSLKRTMALGIFYLAFEGILQIVRSRAQLVSLRTWVTVSGVLATLYAVVTRSSSQFGARALGAFGNPNSLGLYLAGCLTMAFSLLLATRRRGRARLVPLLATTVIFYGLWISGSRGALVGAVAGCLFISLREMRRALLGATLLGLVFFGINLVEESNHGLGRMPQAVQVIPVVFENSKIWLGLNGFMETEFTAPPWIEPGVLRDFPQTFGARLMIWYQALVAALESPFYGVGVGNSYFSAVPFDSKTFNNAFNIYLLSFVEGGLFGFVLHLIWISMLIRHAVTVFGQADTSRVGDGLIGSALAFSLHGLVEDTYCGIFANWLIGVLLGALVSCSLAGAEEGAPASAVLGGRSWEELALSGPGSYPRPPRSVP